MLTNHSTNVLSDTARAISAGHHVLLDLGEGCIVHFVAAIPLQQLAGQVHRGFDEVGSNVGTVSTVCCAKGEAIKSITCAATRHRWFVELYVRSLPPTLECSGGLRGTSVAGSRADAEFRPNFVEVLERDREGP